MNDEALDVMISAMLNEIEKMSPEELLALYEEGLKMEFPHESYVPLEYTDEELEEFCRDKDFTDEEEEALARVDERFKKWLKDRSFTNHKQ